MKRGGRWRSYLAWAVVLAACGGGGGGGGGGDGAGTTDTASQTSMPATTESTSGPSTSVQAGGDERADLRISVDAAQPGAEISPLILGVSGGIEVPEMVAAGVTLDSWGGNPSTRYNYQVGHLWNAASDWEFRNTDYGGDGDIFRKYAALDRDAGIVMRMAVPTLGWVAKDSTSCSFPDDEGGCLGGVEADCENPDPIADPRATSVESTPELVAGWVAELAAEGLAPRFIAMDNEPELWGHTHYDVHPECPTYEELLDKYLQYATAIRAVAPDAELTGPVMCCWYDYWRIAPGPADGSGTDFLTWFLTKVREHDEAQGIRTIDVVDVHFYPQTGVFNDETDPETNARRLRSVRALWDPTYTDESWIGEPIEFIPRMRRTIEASYPGLPLFISEWNFGADGTMNGALAIADVLGVYGREGVYAAAYWRSPEAGSPGYYAFVMHGNYDGEGSRFGGRTLPVSNPDPGKVSAYAALDEAGLLRLMLINKAPSSPVTVGVDLTGFAARPTADRFTYGPDSPVSVVADMSDVGAPITLPAQSITVLELLPTG